MWSFEIIYFCQYRKSYTHTHIYNSIHQNLLIVQYPLHSLANNGDATEDSKVVGIEVVTHIQFAADSRQVEPL